ncbi:MAG: hypothetical protein WKF96_22315 [Solirubrobacteraceae bacterium]
METTSFTNALGWLTEWVDREDVEINVGSADSDANTSAALEGTMTTGWDPDVMKENVGAEDAAILRVGRSSVVLDAADFERASRDSDETVRLHMGHLSITVGAALVLPLQDE